jgi:hypothetical protein
VQLFRGTPEVATENIGPVEARCSEDTAGDACLRTLKDVVCKLGGDVVWGVDDPEHVDGKLRYSGRAAHTRLPRKPKPAAPPPSPATE